METKLIAMLTILCLAFVQNISFSIVSRSRNRNNMRYHLIAAFFSNTIWFLTFRQLVKGDMNFVLFIPYCVGTMFGSLSGVRISMWIEKLLGAAADGHLSNKSKITIEDLVGWIEYNEACTLKMLQSNWKYKSMEFREWLANKDLMCPICKINKLDSHHGICSECGRIRFSSW